MQENRSYGSVGALGVALRRLTLPGHFTFLIAPSASAQASSRPLTSRGESTTGAPRAARGFSLSIEDPVPFLLQKDRQTAYS